MTAVAQQPSLHPGPRSSWNANGNGNGNGPTNGTINSVSDEMARIFIKRSSSNSSISSSSSTPSTATEGSSGPWGNSTNGRKKGVKVSRASNGNWSAKSDMMRAPLVSGPPSNSNPPINGNHQPMPILPSQHLMSIQPQQNGGQHPPSYLLLLPLNGTFDRKFIPLPYYPDTLRIGRQTNAKTLPTQVNGYFDSKVLSRQHAEIWAEKVSGRVWIRDIKSSNGTFVNGMRLSQENRDSEPRELRAEDILELGIDIVGDDNKTVVHRKVSARVEYAGLHNPNGNGLDINFGDIDAMNGAPGGSYNGHPLQNGSIRGRSGSQGSRSSMMNGGGVNYRQPPMMLQPITVELMVKKLNHEIQAAKQQHQDLQRTSEILDDVLSPRVAVGALPPLGSAGNNSAPSEPVPPVPARAGVATDKAFASPMSSSTSYFQHQHHLRLHPTADGRTPPSPPPPKVRFETLANNDKSDLRQQGVGALAVVRRELEAKTVRVKDLEEELKKERSARELAEGRASQLEDATRAMLATTRGNLAQHYKVEKIRADEMTTGPDEFQGVRSGKTLDGQLETLKEDEGDPDMDDGLDVKVNLATLASAEAAQRLQRRVEALMMELRLAQEEIERYKSRAKAAEDGEAKSRRTLSEMVEKIRGEEQARRQQEKEAAIQTDIVTVNNTGIQVESGKTAGNEMHELLQNGTAKPTAGKVKPSNHMGNTCGPTMKGGDEEVSLALSKRDAAPYASVLGVMLIGVGLMAVLNRWHKGES